ncbi:MAG: ATP-binding protein [Candidatus Omnitrophica bacterium]|nr:ATP-binding protein [Candidatus Omnitrophota bacterium]
MKRLKDITVRNKILLGYFCIIAFFIGLGIYYVDATRKISQVSRKIELHNFTGVELITEIQRNVLIVKNLQRGIYYVQRDGQLLEIKKHLDIYASKIAQLISELEELEKNGPPDTLRIVSRIKGLFQEYRNLVYKEIRDGINEKVYWEFNEPAALRQLEEELNDLHNEEVSIFSLALGNMDHLARRMRDSYIWTLLILILLSIWIACWIAGIIVKPIMNLIMGMRKLGNGNLDYKIEVKNNDEIGILQNGFMAMANRLKLAHDALQKERDSLEIKVKDRTKDLEQSQTNLIQANEELKRIQNQLIQSAKMAAIGSLAGGVAHEINNPLTGVLNNVELIKMEMAEKNDFAPADFKGLLDIIEESALRCKRIVQGLLEFSHIGKEEVKPALINEVLEKTIALAGNEMRLENIKITKEFANSRPMAKIDVNRFRQVILDIINNARWALRNKPPHAELRIKTLLSEDKKLVIIEIYDNGCGIEKDTLPHIFEPFFTTKKIGEGTGLGLSISYQIIKELNGVLEAESEGKDKGATFRIKLPAAVN